MKHIQLPANLRHRLQTIVIASVFVGFGASTSLASTVFFRSGDLVIVSTTDYTSQGTYFIWESKNVKYRLEMCQHAASDNHPANGHVRFKYDPHINANSFAIVSEGQVFPFPMPSYQNKQPWIPGGAHLSVIPYPHNEVKFTESSAAASGDISIDVQWTTLEGAAKQKKLNGRDEVTFVFRRLGELIQTMPASSVPQYVDLFSGESLLITKSNVRTMQSDIERIIKAWMSRSGNSASAAGTPSAPAVSDGNDNSNPDTFIGNGPQGQAYFDFSKNGGAFTIKNGVDTFQTKWGRRSMYQVNASAGLAGKIGGKPGLTTLPTLSAAKLMDFTNPSRVVAEGEVVIFRNVQGKFVAVKLMNVEDSVHGGSQDRLTIRWKVLQQ